MTKKLESPCFFNCRRYTLTVLSFLLLSTTASSAVQREKKEEMAMRLGGCGGVYFYASAGEFWVEVQKQDLNIRNTNTHLWALLVGPDRQVIDQGWIGDDAKPTRSGPGPVQRVLLRTNVKRPGVYGLNITVTQDRYGENMSWGFRTNCRKFLVETSRGHKDERHEEPIVLRNSEAEGDVGFMPRVGPFSIDVTGLAKSVKEIGIFDRGGRENPFPRD